MSVQFAVNNISERYTAAVRFLRVSPLFFALILFISLLLAALYFSGVQELVYRWHAQPEYSHGFLIPLVSLYVLWEKRSFFFVNWDKSNVWGVVLLFLFSLIAIVGEVSALYLLVHISLIFSLFSLLLVLVGNQSKHAILAIGFLFFAIPLPYFIEAALTSKLQLWSSSIGVSFIRVLGIPVYLDGNIVDLGSFKLHVVEACSGLRYLFPLLCVGVITAYFYASTYWKRAFVVVSCVPIAIAMNSLRIAITALLVKYYGSATADGFIHAFEGWVVFLVCLGFLIVEIYLLERFTTQKSLAECFSPKKNLISYPSQKNTLTIKHYTALSVVSILLIAVNISLHEINRRSDNVDLVRSLATFPMKIDEWHGQRKALDAGLVGQLEFDDYLLANYSSPLGKVNLYVAYYANQRKGVSPHSPKVCIPGGGWEINSVRTVVMNDTPVNQVEIQKGLQKQLVYYWFVERGKPVANEYVKKLRLLRDAIFENRTDGALVRIVTNINQDDVNLSVTKSRIERFLASVNEPLAYFMPEPPRS